MFKKLLLIALLMQNVAAFAGVQGPPAYNGAPYFQAYPSAATTAFTTSSTAQKVTNNTKIFDSGTYFDATTNYRFTPLLSGKYLVHAHCVVSATNASSGQQSGVYCQLYKNGTVYVSKRMDAWEGGTSNIFAGDISLIMNFNGSTDYVEQWAACAYTSSCTYTGGTSPLTTYFEATYLGP